jgi:hypothetical protein
MRTVVFIDGQNLYHLALAAWAPPRLSAQSSPYSHPSYDVEKIALALVGRTPGRVLTQVRFYTGVPDPARGRREAFWHGFWDNKLRYLRSRGIYVYRGRVNPGGQEKGVDVSLAVDLVQFTYEKAYDAAIIVSQDWDFGSAVRLAKKVAKDQQRWLTFDSAFPFEAGKTRSPRGVPGCTWIHIDKATYDACYDPTDYRPADPPSP